MFSDYIQSLEEDQVVNIIKSIRYGHKNRDWDRKRFHDIFKSYEEYSNFCKMLSEYCKKHHIVLLRGKQCKLSPSEIYKSIVNILENDTNTEDLPSTDMELDENIEDIEDVTDSYLHK